MKNNFTFRIILFCTLLTSIFGCSKKVDLQEKYDLGIKYLSENNYEEAILMFNEVIEIDEKNFDAFNSLLDAYLYSGNYVKYDETLQKMIELFPENDDDISYLNDHPIFRVAKTEEISQLIDNSGTYCTYSADYDLGKYCSVSYTDVPGYDSDINPSFSIDYEKMDHSLIASFRINYPDLVDDGYETIGYRFLVDRGLYNGEVEEVKLSVVADVYKWNEQSNGYSWFGEPIVSVIFDKYGRYINKEIHFQLPIMDEQMFNTSINLMNELLSKIGKSANDYFDVETAHYYLYSYSE